jgi:hypothetical protein
LLARHAWADNPLFSLTNGSGIPASPFRTDGPQLPVALNPAAGSAAKNKENRVFRNPVDASGRYGAGPAVWRFSVSPEKHRL